MSSLRILSLFLLAALVGGCTTFGYPSRYPDTRYPDSRYPDTRRAPDARRAAAAVHARTARDAERYVEALDRRLRLNRRQERRIHRLLTDRAFDRVARHRGRDAARAYPFPRRVEDRHNRSWWRSTDRQVERHLNGHQRRAYRDYVRAYERGQRHDNRRGNRSRGHLPGRGDRGR